MPSQGAAVDDVDNDGDTALHMAAREGYVNVVFKLLDLGANPLLLNAKGDTALHMAAQGGLVAVVSSFIARGIDVGARDNSGATALHFAAGGGHIAMVARLIDRGIDVNVQDNNGATALHSASGAEKADSVRMLLDKGCDIHAVTHDGFTPLRFAACAHDSSVLAYFLNNDMGNQHEYHPTHGNLLHSAASSGSTAALRLLVDKGLDLTSTIASTGETAVHLAARNGKSGAVRWLLDHGASLDVHDIAGIDPCVAAVVKCSAEWEARAVLEAVAESAIGNSGLQAVVLGRNLIHYASAFGRSRCVELLISKGAAVDSKTVDVYEETAMHCAASYNCVEVAETLAKAGATVDARNVVGMTPLRNAASKSHVEMAVLLLDLGASCDVADVAGMTPLCAAASAGSTACCSLLVAKGADMMHRDNGGRTALGAALESQDGLSTEREAVVKLLVGLGCPVTEAEMDAASRGAMSGSLAKAITARMDRGAAAQQLAMAMSKVAPSLLTVRLSRHSAPRFSSRHLPSSAARANGSSKVYHVDGSRLRHAVSELEGPDEADRCLFLKLLYPPTEGWAASYHGVIAEDPKGAADQRGMPHPAGCTLKAGSQGPATEAAPSAAAKGVACPACAQPATPSAAEVCLSCNGDDFDEAGFEAVLEYVQTGQVSRGPRKKKSKRICY